MNSGLIVNRIQRVLDTDGRGGDGASVAKDYAAAVDQAIRRLNTCMSYLTEAQQSEAIRIAEESPGLLDECATLSFVQLPLWRTMCQDNDWSVAEDINEHSIEKLNAVYASASALEPLLKLYRKAVRMQEQSLTIRCLRRIIAMDKDNIAWCNDLAPFEFKYIADLKSQFKNAADSGDREGMLRVADEIESGGWSIPVDTKLLGDIADMRKADREMLWRTQFVEDVDLLKKAYDAVNFPQTQKFLRNIRTIESQGFVVPPNDQPLLDEISEWCELKSEEAKRLASRSQALSDLHGAIELEDEARIRTLLSLPDFAEVPPAEDIEKRARLVLQRFEIKQSRKRKQVITLIALALISSGVAAGLKYREVCRSKEKAALFARLEFALSQRDETALQKILQDTKQNAPSLYSDGDVKIWDQKLSDLAKKNSLKRQSFDLLMGEIQKAVDEVFGKTDDTAFSNSLVKAKDQLPPNDLDREKKLAKARVSFESYCAEKARNAEKAASDKLNELLARSDAMQKQLQSERLTDDVMNGVAGLKKEFENWQNVCSNRFPQLKLKHIEAFAALITAEQSAQAILEKLNKIESATSLDEWLAYRDVLVKYCSAYPEVQPMMALVNIPYRDALEGTLSVFKQTGSEARTYAEANALGKMKAIIQDIKDYEKIDSQTAMYAVYKKTESLKDASVYSLGQPTLLRLAATGVGTNTEIRGMLYAPARGSDEFKDDMFKTYSDVTFAMMPHCKYINDLINKVSSDSIMASTLVPYLIAGLEKIKTDAYLTDYKRIQLLKLYYGYLSELAKLSGNDRLQIFSDDLQSLAQPVKVGNDPTISWLFVNLADVKDREKACSAFLKRSGNITDVIKQVMLSQEVYALLARLKVAYVGSVSVRDKRHLNFVNPKESYGEMFALRMDDNSYKLHHVLTKTGDRYVLRANDTVLTPGEPLFVFVTGTQITSLPTEVKTLLRIYSLYKNPDVRINYPPSWPVGLEVK